MREEKRRRAAARGLYCMRGAHLLARAAVAVRQIRRDRELTLLADAHATQPVIPAFDDLTLT